MPWLGWVLAVFAIFGFPILLCALIGRAKQRRWYWFALMGLLSYIGCLIALGQRTIVENENLPDDVRHAGSSVKLFWNHASGSFYSVGLVEAEIRLPIPYFSETALFQHSPLTLAQMGQLFRAKAYLLGANAVEDVEFFRSPPLSTWTMAPMHTIRASGHAIVLYEEDYAAAEDNVEAFWRSYDITDPMARMADRFVGYTVHGVIVALFSGLLASVALIVPEPGPSPYLALAIGGLVLSVIVLAQSFILMKRREPGPLLIIAIMMIVMGAFHLSENIIAAIGGGLGSGIWLLKDYPSIARQYNQYQRARAELEALRAKDVSRHGAPAAVDSG